MWWFFWHVSSVSASDNSLLIPVLWNKSVWKKKKWLAFPYYDRHLKPICFTSHILLKGCPWEALIWWTPSNSFVKTKSLGKVNHLPQPRGLGWVFVYESSKAQKGQMFIIDQKTFKALRPVSHKNKIVFCDSAAGE